MTVTGVTTVANETYFVHLHVREGFQKKTAKYPHFVVKGGVGTEC